MDLVMSKKLQNLFIIIKIAVFKRGYIKGVHHTNTCLFDDTTASIFSDFILISQIITVIHGPNTLMQSP